MSNWPDPDKPGVPLNPEQDGRHWLFDPEENKPHPEIWVAEIGAWAVGDAWTPRMVAEMGLHYQGPVLTPAEADALRAENARLREARVRVALAREEAARTAYNRANCSVLALYEAWVAAEAEVRAARHNCPVFQREVKP